MSQDDKDLTPYAIESFYSYLADNLKLIKETSKRNFIIYTISSYGTIKLVYNLIKSLNRIKLYNHLVISLDKKTHKELLSNHIPSILFKSFKPSLPLTILDKRVLYHPHHTTMYLKVLEFKSMVIAAMSKLGENMGMDTFFVDSDTAWLKDPYDYINKTDYDLYLQMFYMYYPERKYEDEYIRTLCDVGILYSRHGSGTSKIYSKIPRMLNIQDTVGGDTDSNALISYIIKNKDSVTVSTSYKNNKEKGKFNIKLLDYNLFPTGLTIRDWHEDMKNRKHDFYIAHCNLIPDIHKKIQSLKQIDMWFL